MALRRRHPSQQPPTPAGGISFQALPRLPWLGEGNLMFWKIKLIPRFWEPQPSGKARFQDLPTATLRFVQQMSQGFGFVLIHHGGSLQAGWISAPDFPMDEQLDSCYPGIELERSLSGIPLLLRDFPPYPCALLVNGNPYLPSEDSREKGDSAPDGLDLLVEGLGKYSWLYTVIAFPLSAKEQSEHLGHLYGERTSIKTSDHKTSERDVSGDVTNDAGMKKVEDARIRTEEGLRIGLWRSTSVLFLHQKEGLATASALLRNLFFSKEVSPLPFEIHVCVTKEMGHEEAGPSFESVLNSKELSRFLILPQKPHPGFVVCPLSSFDLHRSECKERLEIFIGNHATESNPVFLTLRELSSHMLILGSDDGEVKKTGFFLLRQLWKIHRVPFLMLEASGTSLYGEDLASMMGSDLRLIMPAQGKQDGFYLDLLAKPDGVSVETHCTQLIRIFRSVWHLPHLALVLLEDAVHLWSEEFGDNTAHSEGGPSSVSRLIEILRDLLNKRHQSYEQEILESMEKAIVRRLENLRDGWIGQFFLPNPSERSLWRDLIQKPVVFSLETITNPEERTLVMLLFLYRIMENARTLRGRVSSSLHATLIQGAHLVFRAFDPSVSPGQPEYQAVSIEEFATWLFEAPSVGEGLLLLEEEPNRLAKSVLRNVRRKLLHRITEAEGLTSFCQTAGLTNAQSHLLSGLQSGEAILLSPNKPEQHLRLPRDLA